MSTFTRRDWLATAASLAVAGRLGAAPAAKVPFGFSLYGMKSLPTAEALKTCAAIGYDSIEFALMPGYPTDTAKLTATDCGDLRKQVADRGLAVSGLMENLPIAGDDAAFRKTVDRMKLALALARDLVPERPPIVETILGGKPAEWEAIKEKLADRVAVWAEAAAAAKVIVAVKPHVGNAMHTVEGTKWLVSRVNSPWLRLAFDTSHFEVQSVPVAEAVAALLPFTVFVHIKDVKGTPAKFEFLLPGDGATDYPTYFGLLKKAGYAGPVVVEVSGQVSNKPGYDPVAAAKRCFANITPALMKAGLRG